MSKSVKFGNILTADAGLIVHGCNAHGVMGSGVAGQIREKWPACFSAYADFCKGSTEMKDLLGQIVPYEINADLIVINAITQLHFGIGRDAKKYVDYQAVQKAFDIVADIASAHQFTVHYPLIGAGLGGGDWSIISEIIDCCFEPYPAVHRTLWIYE